MFVLISFLFQKSDSDLTFEDGSPLSDDRISSEKSRTKLVSKRDSDKEIVDDNQFESDEGWMGRVKRSFSGLFAKDEEKVVEKREVSEDLNKSEPKIEFLTNDYRLPSRRRRQVDDDDEDDDEDNEIASGDHDTPTPDPEPVTHLPPVKDDKYCEIFWLLYDETKLNRLSYLLVRMKVTVEEYWVDQFKDKSSSEFKQMAETLKSGVEKIFAEKTTEATTILARVVEIR